MRSDANAPAHERSLGQIGTAATSRLSDGSG
jgi:hypothetical protein